ncbi:MAG: hypothetical protein FWG03_04930 [Clostridiales bacterium]|nr:hypothetical protein [Clostridiales bacterium]
MSWITPVVLDIVDPEPALEFIEDAPSWLAPVIIAAVVVVIVVAALLIRRAVKKRK